MGLEKRMKQTIPNVRLRMAREQRGWSQLLLANQLGTTELTVGRWERGERSPQIFYRAKLCELFAMSAEELGLTGEESEQARSRLETTASQEEIPISTCSEPSPPEILTSAASFKNGVGLSTRNRAILAVFILLLVIGSVVGFYAFHFVPTTPRGTSATPAPQIVYTHDISLVDPTATPVLNDSLNAQSTSRFYRWADGNLCTFPGELYRIRSPGVNYCLVKGLMLKDFEYHIHLRMVQGTQAGIVFRANDSSQLYYFYIDINGNYGFDMISAPDGKQKLRTGFSSEIVRGMNQFNMIAVVARNTNFDFYVNRHFVLQVQDSTFTMGNIGICVGDYYAATQSDIEIAEFQQAKVWNLSSS